MKPNVQKINFDSLGAEDRDKQMAFVRACLATGKDPHSEDGVYDLVFTVNGLNVDFRKFCDSFFVNIDELVKKEVDKQIGETSNLVTLRNTIEDCANNLKDQLAEMLVKKCGLEEHRVWDAIYATRDEL